MFIFNGGPAQTDETSDELCFKQKFCDKNKGSSSSWFTSEKPERDFQRQVIEEMANEVHLLYSAIYFSAKVEGCLAADKTHQSKAISWLQDTHKHTVIYSDSDNKSLLVLLFTIQSWHDLKAKASGVTNTTSHFSPHFAACCLCSQWCWHVFCTDEQSPPGMTAVVANCDFKTNIPHWE